MSHPRRPARRVLATVTVPLFAALAMLAPTATAAAATPAQAVPEQQAGQTVDVRVIAFNDLHGNLEPPAGSSGLITQADGSTVEAGGAAFLATHIAQLRSEAPNSLLLSAGDNIGASPVISALFHDEPTIELMNLLEVDASVVGNHEFDEGYAELRRIQEGGCHPVDGCQFRDDYAGADFPYLGANVTSDFPLPDAARDLPVVGGGIPALLPFTVERSGGVPIGIIGVTLNEVPTLVSAQGIEGLQFGDEVAAINRTSQFLQRTGVAAQVVLLHQGDDPGAAPGGPDSCDVAPDGPAAAIAAAANPNVDAIFTAHSHQQYICSYPDPAGQPRPVVQGASFGRLLTVVDLQVDLTTRDVVRSATAATNVIVTRDVTPDPAVTALIDEAAALAAPIANEPVGTIAADLLRGADRESESTLGNVIADAQLAAAVPDGAQLALMNPGGIRADLLFPSSEAGEGDGVVTYGEAFTVQPFANIMQNITLTGEQLTAVLEQQFELGLLLQSSDSLRYTVSESAPLGSKVSDVTVAGAPLDPAAPYRIAVNNFLAAGGDGFTTLTVGTDVTGGLIDLDALIAYFEANPNLAPPALDRVTFVP